MNMTMSEQQAESNLRWWEPTSRGYEVTGPDKDGDMCIEFDVETNIIWLTRRDVEMLLARWPKQGATP
jgi:hypothetical protein